MFDTKSMFGDAPFEASKLLFLFAIISLVLGLIRFALERTFSPTVVIQLFSPGLYFGCAALAMSRFKRLAIHLFLCIATVFVFLLSFVAGGVSAYPMFLVQILPLVAVFFISNRSALGYTFLCIVGVLFLSYSLNTFTFNHISLILVLIFYCLLGFILEGIRTKYQQKITQLATSHPLTALPTRAVFDVLLKRTAADFRNDETAYVLVFMDVDGLKATNDKFGHPVGDALLREVGLRLSGKIRASETLFHLSGDEFVILGGPTRDLEGLKARFRDISGEFVYSDFRIPLHISVGASLGNGDPRLTLEKADADMYVEKRASAYARR